MSNQQPNVWQTASRSRNSNSASRTPQTRSGTQSPSQPTPPTQPPRQETARGQPQQPQVNNVWTQRSSNTAVSNGPAKTESVPLAEEIHQPMNGFNAAEVKDLLGKDAGSTAAYKPAEAPGTTARSSGGAWGSKPNHMANNQPFFPYLAKQLATIEGGG